MGLDPAGFQGEYLHQDQLNQRSCDKSSETKGGVLLILVQLLIVGVYNPSAILRLPRPSDDQQNKKPSPRPNPPGCSSARGSQAEHTLHLPG